MIEIDFKAWAPFHAQYDKKAFKRWLQIVARESEKAFKGGMKGYPPASSPGQYPAIRTGRLRGSVATRVTDNSVVIGTHMPYSGYLRSGTRMMKRRKMSDNALQEGIEKAKKLSKKWVGWEHG
jgi:phage gpG-like protein